MKTYEKLLEYCREMYAVRSAAALCGWDQETMMPPQGGEGRARALEALSRIVHQRLTAPQLGDYLDEVGNAAANSDTAAGGDGGIPPEGAALVRELLRDRNKALKIPERLAGELARTASLAQRAWVEARPRNDSKAYNPWLEKMMALRREEAEHLGYEESPYDAMLDNYEPGARASRLEKVLGDLEVELTPLVRALAEKCEELNPKLPEGPYDLAAQKNLNQRVLKEMGFSLEAGRLDESAHPFTDGVYPSDVRLTTRYSESDVAGALFSTLHEGGHGLYEQGFLPEHFGTPLAEAVSLGIHESQSRLWENQIGRSEAYWQHYFPEFQAAFPDRTQGLALRDFLRAVNRVKPSLIRVEADEVTYNLHIALRFRLEKALFEGKLRASDLEGAWNEAMLKTLGVKVDKPANGYMQDVHWSLGLVGYFPTYSLGNIYAAQFFRQMEKDIPDLTGKIRKAEFAPLLAWLRENIHRHGRAFSGDELLHRITGEPADSRHLVKYLREKYARLYDLPGL